MCEERKAEHTFEFLMGGSPEIIVDFMQLASNEKLDLIEKDAFDVKVEIDQPKVIDIMMSSAGFINEHEEEKTKTKNPLKQ